MFTASNYAGLGLASSGLQAFGLLKQGQEASKAYDYNASVYDERADLARRAADLNQYRSDKALKSKIGSNIAAFAAAGVNPFTGSPVDHMVESMSNGYLDQAIDRYNSEVAGGRYSSEAEQLRSAGKQSKKESIFKAGMTLLESGSLYSQKMRKQNA